MKKIAILILFLACTLSAALFAACDFGGGNSGNGSEKDGSSVTEVCQHTFARNTFACKDRVCLICGVKVKASEGHTYVKDSVVAPTCEENGYTLNKCACGATQKTDSVIKLGHDFGEYVTTVVASCQTVGVKTAHCSRCDETDNIYSWALPHTFDSEKDKVKAATCTENGYTRHECTVCGEVVLDTYVRAFGHTSDGEHDNTVLPACEAEGYDEHICGTCGEAYTDNYVAATGHSWIDGETTAASCSSVGYKQQECEWCHELRKSDMSTQKTAHVFGADGLCEVCGKNAEEAFALSATRETGEIVYIAPDDADGMRRYVLENIGERETITLVLERSIIDGLIAKGYKGITLRFYNPDELLRLYVWKVSGLNTEDVMANNYAPNGYADTCVEYVPFFNENGELSAAVKENGIQWTLFHTVASGKDCAVADSMGVALEYFKPLHDFDENGVCTDCGKNATEALALSANRGSGERVSIISDDADGMLRYVLENIGELETITVILERVIIDELVSQGYKGVTLRFYNPDELLRLYVWNVSGLNTGDKMANNFAPNGYSDTCTQYIPFFDENGELSAAIDKKGIQWTLFHTVASGKDCAVADSMGVALEYLKEFDVNDKSTWLGAASNHNAKTEYVEDCGWKVTATKGEDYDFKITQETMAYHIAQGKTKLTITFGGAFDEETFVGEPLFCRLWIIPASPDGSRGDANWSYKAGYINDLDISGFGLRTVTIDLTDTTWDFENFSLDMHVTYSDEAGEKKAVGACYIYDIVFS